VATIAYADGRAIQGNATTFNFEDVAIGDAASDRYLVVAAGGVDTGGTEGATVTGIAVDGNAAAHLVTERVFDGSRDTVASAWIIPFPAGALADIAVSFTRQFFSCHLHAYAAYGINPAAFHTDVDSALAGGGVPGLSFGLNIPAGGIGLAAVFSSDNVAAHGWTGMTEGGEVTTFSGGHRFSAAHFAPGAAQEPLAASVAFAVNEDRAAGVAVSFAALAASGFNPAWARNSNVIICG
jgi:hypothetical protein